MVDDYLKWAKDTPVRIKGRGFVACPTWAGGAYRQGRNLDVTVDVYDEAKVAGLVGSSEGESDVMADLFLPKGNLRVNYMIAERPTDQSKENLLLAEIRKGVAGDSGKMKGTTVVYSEVLQASIVVHFWSVSYTHLTLPTKA